MYAKDKKKYQVENHNKSTVNRLKRIIPNPRIKFENTNVGDFDYRMLMRDKDIEIDGYNEIIKRYDQLDLKKYFMINTNDKEYDNIKGTYDYIKSQLLNINSNIYEVVDVLIEYLYEYKDSSYKTTLWECFGDVIVENLEQNIKQPLDDGWIMCEVCGRRVEREGKTHIYCRECGKEKELERKKKWWHSTRRS